MTAGSQRKLNDLKDTAKNLIFLSYSLILLVTKKNNFSEDYRRKQIISPTFMYFIKVLSTSTLVYKICLTTDVYFFLLLSFYINKL